MQTINLDISNKGIIPIIHAKQGDVGRKFVAVLTDAGLPCALQTGSAFSVWYSGASGKGNYTTIGEKGAFSVNGNKVTVEMITQMVSNGGDGNMALVLNDTEGNQIGFWNIPYVVEPIPGADSEEAKQYYTALSGAAQRAESAAQRAEAAADRAESGGGGGSVADSVWTESTINPGCFYRTVNDEKEWLNPPMTIGIEYRTAERSNGNVVYTKKVDCGVAANGENIVAYHNDVVFPVRYSGTLGTNHVLPILLQNDETRWCVLSVQKNKIYIIKGSNIFYGGNAYVQVWYTKADEGVEYLDITTQPENVTASNGDTVYYNVVATGEGLTYQWQFTSSATWANTSMEGATTDTLTVGATTARNGYKYRCIITDKYGNSVISNVATLTVS